MVMTFYAPTNREKLSELSLTQRPASAPVLHVALCPMGYDCWTRLIQSRMPLGTDVAVDSNNGICLQAYREALGITGVSLDVNPGGQIPYERVVHSIRLLTEQVIPKFR